MECLECALLEWGLRLPVPPSRRETDVHGSGPLSIRQTGLCRDRSRIYGRRARPNWANRARYVLLSAINHVRNVGAILLDTYLRSSQKRFTRCCQGM